ncbi:gluconokinase [Fervidobacterium sp.]
MEKDLILAVDVGTTYLKAGLIDSKGNILRAHRNRLRMETDHTGKAEHNVKELSKLLLKILKKTIEGFEGRIAAIVPSTYIFGLMALDSRNMPVTNLITLADTRVRSITDEFRSLFDEDIIYSKTGIPPTFHTALMKAFWILKTLEEGSKNIKFVSCKDYVIFLLTSKILTEPSTASSTGYFNTFTQRWDEDILDLLGLRKGNLPDIVSSFTVLPLKDDISEYLSLPKDVKVVMGLYDGGTVAVAGGIFGKVRRAAVNLGTTGMIRVISEKPVIASNSVLKLQTLYLCDNKWFPGGSVNNAGSVIEWLKRNLKIDLSKFSRYNHIPSDNLFFYPYLTGERGLEFGSEAKGVIHGLESKHSAEDILVSALEGISFTLKLMVEPLIEKGVNFQRISVSGGGTRLRQWISILANVFRREVDISYLKEPALVGSTILSGVALGWFDSLTNATENIQNNESVVVPESAFVDIYEEKYSNFVDTLKRIYALE